MNSAFLNISLHFTAHLFRPWIPSRRALPNTPRPRSDRFWLLELRVSRTFLDQLRPQLSGHGYPARRAGIDGGPRRFTEIVLEGGVTSAVMPGGGSLLIVDSGDQALLGRLHEVFIQGTRGDAAKHGRPDRVTSRQVRGVTVWTFDSKEAHAILGNRLVLASTAETLEAALDCREHPGRPSLEASGRYKAALQAAGSQAVATAYADLTALKKDPKTQPRVHGSERGTARSRRNRQRSGTSIRLGPS